MARMDHEKAKRQQRIHQHGWDKIEKRVKHKRPKSNSSATNPQQKHKALLQSDGHQNAYEIWSKEDDQKLYYLRVVKKLTYSEIAGQLGRTSGSCKTRAKKLRKNGGWGE